MARPRGSASEPAPGPPGGFSRWPWWRRWFGLRSERAAARFLRRRGCRVIATNVADPAGEIDIIAVDGPVLVVVEVRSTAGDDLTKTAESVDLRKQRKITDAAVRFLSRKGLLETTPVRFDVLVIGWPPGRGRPRFLHFPHAFEAAGRRFQFFS